LVTTTIAAYFFSRRGVMHQKLLMKIVMFTMFFSGGLVPTYLWLKQIGLFDNLLVLILPGAISTTNMIIMRTAFYNVPASLEESARLDGAGHLTILIRVIVPLVMPTIAVIALYYSVGHWNSWFNASIYITKRSLYPLQLVLREILITNETASMLTDATVAEQASISETIKYAVIMVSTIPILCLYPFLQRFFVNGVMIGAVKE
ncbi:MAG: carbohydrate ABC transporter permease, partial [Oscillospiraceae bacterium]